MNENLSAISPQMIRPPALNTAETAPSVVSSLSLFVTSLSPYVLYSVEMKITTIAFNRNINHSVIKGRVRITCFGE